ncbi:succinate:fumarate antiporter [Phaffia rhodozyma]|uniref:hydroxyacylglutathione hydrolase n=1 Tax=Phaffia rhodozyma TaxID=264483 RepID=A0A0F7SFH2_PHARH|nr:succinate:fumarate antiporter [Phaffia rhodozyma]
MAEACICHPLDTIKVRMQLTRSRKLAGLPPLSFYATGRQIVAKETPLGLYKGLGAVIGGIVPKMAIRFASFEMYKGFFADSQGKTGPGKVFISGLLAGATEAVAVVTPMEVVKIRLQAQLHSLSDPSEVPKYRNAAHAAYRIVGEEGLGTLYRGVGLTALRQATNQGVNFTAYQEFKKLALNLQPAFQEAGELPSYQTLVLGLVSGAMGPFSNAPIDTIKTRIQKASKAPGETAISRFMKVAGDMFREEGAKAFYKGITPRVLRVAPGQAIVFTVYEKVKGAIENLKASPVEDTSYDASFATLSTLERMKITPIKARSDNWMYIIQDTNSKKGAVVDPFNAEKISAEVAKQGVEVTHLITTHHHYDHAGGNKDFVKNFPNVVVTGGSNECEGVTQIVKDGETFKIGDDLEVTCIHTPCHTQDSICYYVVDKKSDEKVVFTGDTLFTAGCGRFFEGTPEEMHSSLQKLMKLPETTKVLNGHEYTAGSAKFGAHVEPKNESIQTLLKATEQGDCVLNGYTIGDEKRWNVFVRLGEKSVQEYTRTVDPVTAMGVLREKKNSF